MRLAFLFTEPSTRTYTSFYMAALNLGFEVVNIPPENSSIVKGESLQDTIETLNLLGFDGIVLRHSYDYAHKVAQEASDIPVIDAGSGIRSHPSQALIDLETLRQRGLDTSARVGFLGDVSHSRVFKSLADHLTNYVVLAGPLGISVDVFYCLRPQRERGFVEDYSYYKVTGEHMKSGAYLMHPGPYTGVEFDRDLLDHPNCLVRDQVRNSVPVRMKILEETFNAC